MNEVIIKNLGITKYSATFSAMKFFTANRNPNTTDQIWLTEHYPVYTLGLAGNEKDLLTNPFKIPLVRSDRGGQITFHTIGQVVIYTLINLSRKKIGVKAWVNTLEQVVIDFVKSQSPNINVHREIGKHGVYINSHKISALGLKIKNGCCYHGLAINVKGDFSGFANINPCGYKNMKITSLAENGINTTLADVANEISHSLETKLSQEKVC